MANNNIEGQILAGDKTILDVFGEKSRDADNVIEKINSFSSILSGTGGKNIFGQEVSPLTEEDLLMMLPMGGSIGGGRAAKGMIQQILDIAKRKNIRMGHPKKWGYPKKELDYWELTEKVDDIDDFIKTDDATDALKKILKKYKIEDPDKIFRGFTKN